MAVTTAGRKRSKPVPKKWLHRIREIFNASDGMETDFANDVHN